MNPKDAVLKLQEIIAAKKVALRMLASHIEAIPRSKTRKVKKAFWLSESMYLRELEEVLAGISWDPDNEPREEG